MLSDIKKEIDQYFDTNWTLTPIQFETAGFVVGESWISLSFVPIARVQNSCQRVFEESQLKILCYATSALKLMELADAVNQFADCLTLSSCSLSVGDPDGLGVQPLDNDVYELALIFTVQKTI